MLDIRRHPANQKKKTRASALILTGREVFGRFFKLAEEVEPLIIVKRKCANNLPVL
jgi:hypothetical protein